MSDDDKNETSNANSGVTLPDGVNATYDISLTPLFFGRNGRGNVVEYMNVWRGGTGFFWSLISYGKDYSYRMGFNQLASDPILVNNRAHALSLRCLVSTNK